MSYRTLNNSMRIRPTRDAILNVPTAAEWGAYLKARGSYGANLGKFWDPLASALDETPEDLKNEIYNRLDHYRAKDRRKTRDASLPPAKGFDIFGRAEATELKHSVNQAARAR